jgi:predicted nucleic acid-binding Zn ribbon protein
MKGRAHVGDVLRRVIRRAGLQTRLKRVEAVAIWPQVVGQPAAGKCRAMSVRDGVLIVSTSDAVWANVLTLEKPRYLDRLQERLGAGVIRDIRFSSRGWREQPVRAAPARKGRVAADFALAGGEQEAVERLASGIADPDLRLSVHRGVAALIKMRKWRRAHGWQRCESCGRLHRGKGPRCGFCQM